MRKTVRALSLLLPKCKESTGEATQEWRTDALHMHELHSKRLKIVGMAAATCRASPDNLWDHASILHFDDCII